MQLKQETTPNKWVGGNKCQVIIIHQWDDPAKHPTLDGVINHFKDPNSQVSAHYVVQDDLIIQFADDTDRCWHARSANPFAIGIEVDPNFPGETKQTVRELVAVIRMRRGNIPLKKHSEYVNTSCGKDINLADYEGGNMEEKVTIPLREYKDLLEHKAKSLDAQPIKEALEKSKAWPAIQQHGTFAVVQDLWQYKEDHPDSGSGPKPITRETALVYINENLK